MGQKKTEELLRKRLKEKGLKVFEGKLDLIVFIVLLALLALCVYFLSIGRINPFG